MPNSFPPNSPPPSSSPPSSAQPLVHEITPCPDPVDVFQRMAHLPYCIFLDSAMRHESLGRYSYVAANPYRTIIQPCTAPAPLNAIREELESYQAKTIPGLPPFQGGAAGLLSYDIAQSLERIPAANHDEFNVPNYVVGFYDTVIAFDHQENQCFVIAHGPPHESCLGTTSKGPWTREQHAQASLDAVLEILEGRVIPEKPSDQSLSKDSASAPLSKKDLAPQFDVGEIPNLTSDFSQESYIKAVERTVEYIRAGDIFQANLSQRLLHPATTDSVSLYLKLREKNPATFAGYFDTGEFQIVSASPERFLRVHNNRVEARPIKGTRPRQPNVVANLFSGDELQQSEKDRAENIMILDLLRNDISEVCVDDSIKVTQLCDLETYETVQHLVSAVEGDLLPGKTAIDLLNQSFPGGSITGAPKVRAMEIIAELEPTARGAYCGSLGYIGFDGAMDMSILIRTITAGKGWWQIPVGGGVVAQSDPQREYEETWHKAEGMLRAIR